MNARTRAELENILNQLAALTSTTPKDLDEVLAVHDPECAHDADRCTAVSFGLAVTTVIEPMVAAHQLPDINASNSIHFFNVLAHRLVSAGIFSKGELVDMETEAYATSASGLIDAYAELHEQGKAAFQAKVELAQILDEHGVVDPTPAPVEPTTDGSDCQ